MRQVRLAISQGRGSVLSQQAFAKLVGTSPATIQSIELGRLQLSPALANRISVATGADPYSLLQKHGAPLNIFREPYTAKSFGITKGDQWPADAFKSSCKRAILYLEALLTAADSAQKRRSLPLLLSFDNWLRTARREFALESESARTLRQLTERVDPETGKSVWEEWTTAAFASVTAQGNVLLPLSDPPEPWARQDVKLRSGEGRSKRRGKSSSLVEKGKRSNAG